MYSTKFVIIEYKTKLSRWDIHTTHPMLDKDNHTLSAFISRLRLTTVLVGLCNQ